MGVDVSGFQKLIIGVFFAILALVAVPVLINQAISSDLASWLARGAQFGYSAYADPSGHLVPAADNTYDVGTSALSWSDGVFDGNVTVGGTLSVVGDVTLSGVVGPAVGETLDLSEAYSRAYRPTEPGLLTPYLSIVFDDGTDDSIDNWYPILAAQGEVASIAINSSTIGTAGYLTWAEVLTLYNAGWEVINHGSTHTDLTGVSLAAARVIIEAGKAAIEAQGIPVYGFAYPYGASNNDINDIVRESHVYGRAAGGVSGSSANPIIYGTVPGSGGSLKTYYLSATGTDDSTACANWLTDRATASTRRQWAIFYWHTYDETPGDTTCIDSIIDAAQAASMPIANEGIVTSFISGTFGTNNNNQIIDVKGRLRLDLDGTTQTGNRLEWMNSADSVMGGVNSSGSLILRDGAYLKLGADSNLANSSVYLDGDATGLTIIPNAGLGVAIADEMWFKMGGGAPAAGACDAAAEEGRLWVDTTNGLFYICDQTGAGTGWTTVLDFSG
jgi:peptidoglycan/xylan/chitin deacetylase (PgdA/CDA1 family)